MRVLPVLVLFAAAACRSQPHAQSPIVTREAGVPDAAPPPSVTRGLTVEHHGPITLVRIDPSRFALRLLFGHADGGARPAPAWVKDFALTGAINTSMYRDDGRSIGLLARDGAASNPKDNPKLGGFLFFDAIDPAHDPAVRMVGRDCPGIDVDALRARYRSVVQDYRMLDCDGKPLPWKDAKVFSAAAIALDRQGRIVFVHSRAPHDMNTFDRLIAAPELGLEQALYVEGGPEASLYVHAGGETIAEMGSFETDFHDDSNRVFWPIPNVLGFAPLTAAGGTGTSAP